MQKRNKFKFIAVLLLTVGSYTCSLGQSLVEENTKQNSWRTMVGYSFFGGGDISGLTVINEYNRYLTPHIRIAPNFRFSSAKFINTYKGGLNNQEDDFLSQQANIIDFGVMGYYEYLNPNKSGLELGLGFFYRNLQHTFSTGPYTTLLYDDFKLDESSVGEYSENTIGFNVSIGFIINISEIITLNFNGIVQSDT
ncbi:MAG: hypothetical protein L3J06_05365, partial [Cyclobacteriaceae bacterium]|nr:hypothetical protein [Cyclobacteriaceae bacterium]